MRIVRFAIDQEVHAGVVIDDAIARIDQMLPGITEIRQLASEGPAGLERLRAALGNAVPVASLAEVRLLEPIERPGKYLGIGMNYSDHATEASKLGLELPIQQLWFNKQTSCVSGPFDPIDPGVTEKLDYEVELGVVIGSAAKSVSEADAPKHVFGYLVANDVSARDWQFHSQTFTMGKSFDTHGPIGPWIVTADEIPDPHHLDVRCYVNGALRQSSNTAYLIFNVWQQIAYLSTAFTLNPGDILATGTPAGVGVAMDPPTFLQPGDVVRCEIEKVGTIENRVIQPRLG